MKKLFNLLFQRKYPNIAVPPSKLTNTPKAGIIKLKQETKLTVLCFADLHFHYWTDEEREKLKNIDYDICFLLGDIQNNSLEEIKNIIKTPIYGILGNHDTFSQSMPYGIEHLHLKTIEKNGYIFGGFSGAVRYKGGDYAMWTQEESLVIAENIGETFKNVDVLISHDSCYGLFSQDEAHCGLKGITKIIKDNNIKVNLTGHQHDNIIVQKYGCNIICLYRCVLINLPELAVKRIF